MRISLSTISLGGVALAALSVPAFSQVTPPPPPATATQAAVYDPQQFPTIKGEVDRLTLTARGDVDGIILKDGVEVKTSPELSTQIAFALKPGDRVTIHGLRAAALPLVRAVSITDDVTHRTVTDAGESGPMNPPGPRPPPPRGAPPPAPGANSEAAGRVRMALHGAQGEVNGVLLESGTILRFPPDRADQLASIIAPRQAVVAEGIAVTTALGTVMDVRQFGPSRDRLVDVGPPMPPDDRSPAGPRRAPLPPPNGPLSAPPPANGPLGAPPPAAPAPPPGAPAPPPPAAG